MAVALAVSMQAQATRFDYQIGVGIEHNDNITLSEDDPVSENVLRPSLGFRLTEDGSTVQAYVDGILEYHDYLDGRYDNEVRGQLTGRMNWNVLPERLDLVVEDVLGVQPLNTLAANTPSNLQQTNVLSIGPTLRFRLGSATRGLAEFRYIDSQAQKTDFFDSRRFAGTLRLIWDRDATSKISANAQAEHIDFANEDSPSYNRYSAYARYARTLRIFDFGADLGYTQLKGSEPIGSHGKPLARANLGWHPDQVSSFTLSAAHQYTDAASSMIETADARVIPAAGAPIPTGIVTGGAVVSSSPYLENRIALSYAWQGVSTSFGVTPFYHQSSYLVPANADSTDLDQSGRGANLFANWLLRPRWNLGAFATFEDIDYRSLDRSDRNWLCGVFLLNQWTRHWSWRAELSRNQRDSSAAGQSNEQNIIYLSMAYTR
jgi:hypothetical protein